MPSRRKFLRTSMLSSLGVSALGSALANVPTILDASDIRRLASLSDNEGDYWQAVRMQFPLKEGQTYFNNGTLGPMPNSTLNAITDNLRYNAVHAAETDYKGNGPQLLTGYFKYEDTRKRIGALINAAYDEIALTQNATFGMNYVANGLDLRKGDEIINTNQEHGGGFAAWQLLAKRRGCGYKQAVMPVPANDPHQIVEAIFKEVTPKTKVIAIPHIVSVYGVVMPVKEICARAREKGIFTIIDGAQAVGQVKVDVRDIGCDAYYSSLHKWLLAPAGSGILYVRKERMPEIWATIASYNWDNQEDHGFRLMQNGTGNTALLAGLNAALDFYEAIGEERWLGRIKQLGDYLRAGLQQLDKVTIVSSTHPDMAAGITTYKVAGLSGPELQKRLWDEERLQPRSVGQELLRHSVHIYNNEEEIERTFKVIKNI
ncbi:MAG TPA: aminotransferase class V-fold PLP-dependent enzyme [Flammeovirgaceae bacterium]|nr:aminotransferase class V-fold PLP-dependent enzyme [Flammeovirgaceae bacterium]